MNGAATLFAYECRRVVRSAAVWMVVIMIAIAGSWGAVNTARLHSRQQADLARMAQHEAEWYADIELRAARYARPSAKALPYWQDPTGASGFSRYFLQRFAAKPHLPLSVLAVGQSDLQPFAIPIRLETLFGGDRVYDFEPPRALATGFFDLSFVITFILPFCLGAVAATVGAQERDQAILPLIAAQPVTPRRWWLLRLGAIVIVVVPAVVLCVLAALIAAGTPVRGAWREILAAMTLLAAHTVFWLAVGGWSLARGRGSVGTMSAIAGLWLLLTIGVPLAGSVALRAIGPTPSPVSDVDELRRTTDAVQAEADAVVARGLVTQLGPAAATVDPRALDYSTRLVLITQEMERRLADQEKRRQEHARAERAIANAAWWLSPQVALHTALADLAGTGTARHQAFLGQVRDFQLALRAFMYPRVLAPVRSPAARGCDACPGRFTFVDYQAIPRFAFRDDPAAVRLAAALGTASWLAIIAAVIAAVGVGNARWALDS
jgi:ABC-2 type transport system permease protein